MIERVDEVLHSCVLAPWESECGKNPEPWTATARLRRDWSEMVLSTDRAVAVAGAMGLARVSHMSREEAELVENFFNTLVRVDLPMEALAAALLSGASPPHIFLQAFVTSHLLSPENSTNPFYWGLFSSYVRHPHSAEALGDTVRGGLPGIKYLSQCNPLVGVGSDGGHWFAALAEFKGEGRKGAAGRTEIASIARLLRVDTDKTTLRGTIKSLCLGEAIEGEISNHPVFDKGAAPAIDHLSPSMEAIDYFSGDDAVCRIWRFYNPLLVKPWLMEGGGNSTGALEHLGKLLCGMIPLMPYTGEHSSLVSRLVGGHPLSNP